MSQWPRTPGHTGIVKLLLEAGADVTAVDPGMKAMALHDAIWENNVETARVIIDAGADLTLRPTPARRRWISRGRSIAAKSWR